MYKIETGIPIAAKHTGNRDVEFDVALNSLKIGQSFVVPTGKRASYSYKTRRLKPKTFTRRTVDNKTFRIWRTQ